MSHIHFIGGEKGGVGKSVVARLLAQYWIDRSMRLAAIDGDLSHGALLRHYRDYSQPANLALPESADQILDRALGGERRVLVDLPAQSAQALYDWIQGANVLGVAREMGVPVTFWHVTDGGFASVGQIERALNLYGDLVQHIVVRNHGRSKDFRQLDASSAQAKLQELGGKTIELPELDPGAMYRIDSLGLSFWAASYGTEGEDVLRPLERERVKLWLQKAYERIQPFAESL